VAEAEDRPSALALVRKHPVPVVILDLGLPPDADGPSEGLRALEEILSTAPQTKVIVMSGQSEREYAIRAVGAGAYDFYQKPLDFDSLNLMVGRAIRLYELEAENRRLVTSANASPLPGLVTNDPKMLKVCEQLRLFAAADMTVLLVGESGTGKELLARAIHTLSKRSAQPYVAINCAAVPDTLLESEFFGHEKGTFTGAHKSVAGKAEMANKGTLLLDEIGDLPIALQAKLLRFLQERVVERVGGRKLIPVDIRVISATNRDPKKLIEEGLFREDLYYRLSEAVVSIPPLRERPSDIVAISQHLLAKFSAEAGFAVRSFTLEALAAMTSYPWPGNVRELENRIKRAVVTSQTASIGADAMELSSPQQKGGTPTLRDARENAERTAIQSAMAEAGGNVSKAANILETSRPTLYQLMKRYQIGK
jgi:two-component system NtrC family response regulator